MPHRCALIAADAWLTERCTLRRVFATTFATARSSSSTAHTLSPLASALSSLHRRVRWVSRAVAFVVAVWLRPSRPFESFDSSRLSRAAQSQQHTTQTATRQQRGHAARTMHATLPAVALLPAATRQRGSSALPTFAERRRGANVRAEGSSAARPVRTDRGSRLQRGADCNAQRARRRRAACSALPQLCVAIFSALPCSPMHVACFLQQIHTPLHSSL